MTVIKSEFFLALNQVATERGISADDVIESIKSAVLAAYKKDYHPTALEPVEGAEVEAEEEKFEVTINQETGETHILEEGKDITPPGFGRIAAQTARQVILQKIREAEKKTIIQHYVTQVGTTIKGRVIRYDGKNAYLDIGKTEAILPFEEQIRNEQYRPNDTYIVYIKEIKEDMFGNSRIIISRAAPELVAELFAKEVPEVANGTVKIKKVVRDPGERAKIAVFSDQTGVDPVGACVGQKGIRVKAVTDELGGDEKIDIIQWNSDETFFIREALSPAQVIDIQINKEANKVIVTVDETQAPLAIGKGGTNVNLASELTGYIIDIKQTASAIPEELVEAEISKDDEENKAVVEEKPEAKKKTKKSKAKADESPVEEPQKEEPSTESPSQEEPKEEAPKEE